MCCKLFTESSDITIYVKIAVTGLIVCTLHQIIYWTTSNNFSSYVPESQGGKKYPTQ